MIKKVDNAIIDLMDKAIKKKIEQTGNFLEKDCFLSRIIWNVLFAKTKYEKKRSLMLLENIVKEE